MKHLYVQSQPQDRELLSESMGRFATDRRVSIVDSFDELLRGPFGLDPSEPCARLNGNLVFATSHLRGILGQDGGRTGPVMNTVSADYERGGSIATGPLAELIRADRDRASVMRTASYLPFALNGRVEDREEAEERLARSLKEETAHTDAPLARYIDRNLSWRISKRLARTSITPNQVTITNTMIGLTSAWMFASPSYWMRVVGSLLFLFSITIDGVDGELARLTMTESKFGGMLDIVTDNIVHVAVFSGIFWGCYRESGSSWFVYLIPIVLGGFGLCTLSTYLALSVGEQGAEEWLGQIDRISGRDFAYLLVILALVDRLGFFAWGAAFGTYVFAFVLLWVTYRRWWREPESISETSLSQHEAL